MNDYPAPAIPVNHVEPVPRRIRAMVDGEMILDTTRALYLWEWPPYPRWYIPVGDIRSDVLVDEGKTKDTEQGTARMHGLRMGGTERSGVARVFDASPVDGIAQHVRFDWDAADAWFEEDEQVFVHARSPYCRVDAIRSTREVRVEREGVLLAKSTSPVMVFETGLPTRFYLDKTDVDFSHLIETDAASSCPYKGNTSQYWSVRTGDTVHDDLAWCYDFPTRQLLPITGMIAFYNEKVDITLDGAALARPQTHFS